MAIVALPVLLSLTSQRQLGTRIQDPTACQPALTLVAWYLRQACDSYEAAHALQPASHAALYNWGVALSDMARHLRAVNPGASYDFLLAATDKYGQSLKWNPNNPQVRRTQSAMGFISSRTLLALHDCSASKM